MKTKTAPSAGASFAKASSAKGARATDNNEDSDILQLDGDDTLSATTLTAAEKARHIQAAKAARDDEDDDDDMDMDENDDNPMSDDDDTPDDDELDKEFAEFDLPKSNRGGGTKKAGDDMDDDFRDLGLDTGGGGGGYDDDDDDF